MSDVSLTFLGATRTVTGSRFLVSTGASTVLIDAGLFQGDSDERQLNWKPFPVDPATIDAIVLTHAHLDHCGYLPLLVKRGFRGKIYATHYTAKLAEVTMRDSGRIQEEDAKFAQRKGYSSHKPALPLYTEEDAVQAVRRFAPVEFGAAIDLTSDVTVILHPSGHILGSSFVDLTAAGKRLLFTGDMGRHDHPLLVAPGDIPQGQFDAIVTESTYGDREHAPTTANFQDSIRQTIERGG